MGISRYFMNTRFEKLDNVVATPILVSIAI